MPKLSEFEITGDSKAYHFTAPNPAVATAVVMMMGDGQLGWRDLKHPENELPVFRVPEMRGHWCNQKFGMSMNELMRKVGKSAELVSALFRALQSVELGLPGDTGVVEPQDYRDLRIRAQDIAKRVAQSIHTSVKRNGRIH